MASSALIFPKKLLTSSQNCLKILFNYQKKQAYLRVEGLNMSATLAQPKSELPFSGEHVHLASESDRVAGSGAIAGLGRHRSFLEVMRRSIAPEIAEEIASRQIAYRTNNSSLPPVIARFLEQQWRSHLKLVYLSDGEHSRRWQEAVQTMDQLVWSVKRKRSSNSRQRLFALLPELLQQLHVGLDSIGLSAADQDALFAELAKLHAAAVHRRKPVGEVSTPSDAEDSPVESDVEKPCQPSDSNSESAPIIDMPLSPAKRNGSSAEEQQNADLLGQLNIGSSIEFRVRGSTTRTLHLDWISGQGGVFLFRGHYREEAIYMTTYARLKQCLQERSARIVSYGAKHDAHEHPARTVEAFSNRK